MDNCCDRRLRTFVKIPSEKFNTKIFKQKGEGVKGFLNNDKKLHFSYPEASLIVVIVVIVVKVLIVVIVVI